MSAIKATRSTRYCGIRQTKVQKIPNLYSKIREKAASDATKNSPMPIKVVDNPISTKVLRPTKTARLATEGQTRIELAQMM